MKKAQSENWVFSIARTRCQETPCSLFPIYCRLPKLDAVGSRTGSRNIFNNLRNFSEVLFRFLLHNSRPVQPTPLRFAEFGAAERLIPRPPRASFLFGHRTPNQSPVRKDEGNLSRHAVGREVQNRRFQKPGFHIDGWRGNAPTRTG